jgi:hypothetical protein
VQVPVGPRYAARRAGLAGGNTAREARTRRAVRIPSSGKVLHVQKKKKKNRNAPEKTHPKRHQNRGKKHTKQNQK